MLPAAPAILVEIAAIKGSTPREAGAWMLVSEDTIHGTIGGGAFEYMAIDHARALLRGKASDLTRDIPLGPAIGQCCGGFVSLTFTPFDATARARLEARLKAEEEARPAIFIFGAGHVGKALAAALSPLPFSLTIIETRAGELHDLPPGVETRLTPLPEAEVARIAPGGAAIIVTHDHALDFLIAREALKRGDLFYTGMIGSATKRVTFARWLKAEGGDAEALSRLTLPIGGGAVRDKRPAVIAAMAAAEILIYASQESAPVKASQATDKRENKGELNV